MAAVPLLEDRVIALFDVPCRAYADQAAEHIGLPYDHTRCSIADFCARSHVLARRGALLLYGGVIFEFAWSTYTYWGRSCTEDSFTDWIAKAVGITSVVTLAVLEFRCMKWVILPWQKKGQEV